MVAGLFPRVEVKLVHYLSNLSKGRLILWCYFIWYLVVLVRYFEPNPRLWLTSFGLSVIIGFALYVNTTRSGPTRLQLGVWPTVRLFMMPFCVSSFSACATPTSSVSFGTSLNGRDRQQRRAAVARFSRARARRPGVRGDGPGGLSIE